VSNNISTKTIVYGGEEPPGSEYSFHPKGDAQLMVVDGKLVYDDDLLIP